MTNVAPTPDAPQGQGDHRPSVGIVSTSVTGSEQIGHLLAQEGVDPAHQVSLDPSTLSADAKSTNMQNALRVLQSDEAVEVIVLISTTHTTATTEQVLAQLRSSDKPTVVCFLGADPRLIWRAGGIPAAYLDEAAWRAAAWVRGWDQALISSRLEERDERLAAQASQLRDRLGPGRSGVRGCFASRALYREAQQILVDLGPAAGEELFLCPDPATRHAYLRQWHEIPRLAVVLLDIFADSLQSEAIGPSLAAVLQHWDAPPLVIAYLHGQQNGKLYRQAWRLLADAGVILTQSSAAAARLARLGAAEPAGSPPPG